MSKMKKMFVGVIVLTVIMSFSVSLTAFAAEDITIHVATPSEWTEPGLWAWSAPDGTNAFSAWPGEKLISDGNNDGWYYYSIPSWVNSIIINEGFDGGAQTVDYSIEAKELWATVTEQNDDGQFEVSIVYEAPEGFLGETVVTDAVEDIPKTGNASMAFIWIGIAALSGMGYIIARRKKVA